MQVSGRYQAVGLYRLLWASYLLSFPSIAFTALLVWVRSGIAVCEL